MAASALRTRRGTVPPVLNTRRARSRMTAAQEAQEAIRHWMVRNRDGVLQALCNATLDPLASVYVQICCVGGAFPGYEEINVSELRNPASDWGLFTSSFGSETDYAAAARWQTERLLWLGARPSSSDSLLSKLPPEVVRQVADALWKGSELDMRCAPKCGPRVRFPRRVTLAQAVGALSADSPCLLLLKMSGDASVRPVVWIPDGAQEPRLMTAAALDAKSLLRRKMLFAPLPDYLLETIEHYFRQLERSSGSPAPKMQRRINLNEEDLPKYLAHVTTAAVRAWHEPEMSREQTEAFLLREADDFGNEVGRVAESIAALHVEPPSLAAAPEGNPGNASETWPENYPD